MRPRRVDALVHPLLASGAICTGVGAAFFAVAVARSSVLTLRMTWIVVTGFVVMALARIVPLGVAQIVLGVAAVVAMWPLLTESGSAQGLSARSRRRRGRAQWGSVVVDGLRGARGPGSGYPNAVLARQRPVASWPCRGLGPSGSVVLSCDYARRKTATCHAGPTSCSMRGARPFSRAMRSIASCGRR